MNLDAMAFMREIARQSRIFMDHVPSGADVLLNDADFALSSDGRMMVQVGEVRYFVADDSVARWSPRDDGRVTFEVLQNGAVVRRAVANDDPNLDPPSRPEVN
jgi:hypothetical protein